MLERPSAAGEKAGRQLLGDAQERLMVRHSAANERSAIQLGKQHPFRLDHTQDWTENWTIKRKGGFFCPNRLQKENPFALMDRVETTLKSIKRNMPSRTAGQYYRHCL